MLFTLEKVRDGLTTGLIYKFKFRATNQIGNSQDSNIVEFALADVPAAPGTPQVMLSLTGEKQVAVNWSPIVSSQLPGQYISGYLLEMMDTSNSQGTFQTVYDGTTSYPDITNYWTSYIVSGRSYIFRVKGKYQNGFTSYSQNSLPVWACSPPSDLPRPHLVSVSSMQITLSWS
jgi:hypothetical protein